MIHTARTTTKVPDSELAVITKARDLAGYVLNAALSAPKVFRFTLASRLQNLALDVLEQLIRANEIYIGTDRSVAKTTDEDSAENNRRIIKRARHQREARCVLKLLCNVAVIAKEHSAITTKQLEQITKLSSETMALAIRWEQSDAKRFGQHKNSCD